MQSDTNWLKRLARSRFQNGVWDTPELKSRALDPFEPLVDDLREAVEIFNQHAPTPIRALEPSANTLTIMTLLYGAAQIRFSRNGTFLDISLIRTKDFQTTEQPLTRLTPVMDVFGCPVWKRGTAESSSDQVIKNALLHLLEASTSL